MNKESTISPCYDLHSHSLASDGVLTPSELIERAVECGVDVLALTDHDTTAGLDAARACAEQHAIKLINGSEISTLWNGQGIHIVGLAIDPEEVTIKQLLQQQMDIRYGRAKLIAEKLAKCGIEGAYEGAKKLAPGEVTRAHFSRYLVEIGKVKNDGQAFKRYLAKGKSAFVKADWCDIPCAIEAIHRAGGIAVCAHPLRYKLTNRKIRNLLSDFKKMGGDAVEVAHAGQSPQQRNLLAGWVNELKLYASVGSDFHRPCAWAELGKNLWLPDSCQPVWQHSNFYN